MGSHHHNAAVLVKDEKLFAKIFVLRLFQAQTRRLLSRTCIAIKRTDVHDIADRLILWGRKRYNGPVTT